MSTFQIIVTGLFVAFIVLGIGAFAILGGGGGGAQVGTVTIWGTVEEGPMQNLLSALRQGDKTLADVSYLQIGGAYESVLINAMASGSGPDLFVLPHEDVQLFSDKILFIPYGAVSQGDFINSYVDEGQLFLAPEGLYALPFTVDPLVLYWNRDLFTAAGIAQPPQYWSDLIDQGLATKLTTQDGSLGIRRSAIALGGWDNVLNAKGILSLLIMQAGDQIVARDAEGKLRSVLGIAAQSGAGTSYAESALRFYTEFANPSKTTYSWNRSLPPSDEAFVGGQLAMYVGLASEYRSIAERNPNLRFGVAAMPQLRGAPVATYGRLVGLAISRTSQNPTGAMLVAQKLTSMQAAQAYTGQIGLPSARRDVQVDTSTNAALGVFAQSALMARGWLDPNPKSTDTLFKQMVESVLSGRSVPAQAINETSAALGRLLGN